jgi:SAM-dependent methyltransferase
MGGIKTVDRKQARHDLFADCIHEGGWNIDRLAWRCKDTFRHTGWRGKEIREVGCGRGDMAIYLAPNGARRVVALEPSADGSTPAPVTALKGRLDKLQLNNLVFLRTKVEDYYCGPESFDLIYGLAVIEHIRETRRPLSKDPEAWSVYKEAFSRFYRMMRPSGVLVLTNCSRHSFWSHLQWVTRSNIRSPLAPSVDWPLHQSPSVWATLARETNFNHSEVHWRVPDRLRACSWLADNRPFQYFTNASYILTLHKGNGGQAGWLEGAKHTGEASPAQVSGRPEV